MVGSIKDYGKNILREGINIDIKFVDLSKESADEENYAYAVCRCSRTLSEGIRVPRGDYNNFVRFNCPRCGESLGLAVMGKKYGVPFSVC